MIKSLVLEFDSNQNRDNGKVIYNGPDKQKALDLLEEGEELPEGARREFYANITPHRKRFGDGGVTKAAREGENEASQAEEDVAAEPTGATQGDGEGGSEGSDLL